MKPRPLGMILGAWLSTGCLFADFSYQQESKITGGAIAGMMRVAGAFSKKAREPIRSSVSVKGNRMIFQTGDSAQITDLDKQTITDVNFDKKTYSVITFDQMKEALERAMQKAKSKDTQGVDMNFTASVKETGQTKQVAGFNAKQVILTMEMQAKGQESGNEGAMLVTADMWLAPKSSGYDEVANFYQRMAEKISWTPGGGMLSMGRSDVGKGFAELYKEAAKIDGMPVVQVIRMGAKVEGQAVGEGAGSEQSVEPQQLPSAGEVAGGAAAGAAAGRLGRLGGAAGGLGGFGGLGRRKKQDQEQQAPPPQQANPQPVPARGGTPPGTLIEMTTETSNFSSDPVDSSRFEVPSGFRQVESDLLKSMR